MMNTYYIFHQAVMNMNIYLRIEMFAQSQSTRFRLWFFGRAENKSKFQTCTVDPLIDFACL